ncbi:MAG: hypothetical protein E7632_06020 [Ruminococcaceae bacterium]|nr:hypothetical protein [Oscillospiraceae bacterium]
MSELTKKIIRDFSSGAVDNFRILADGSLRRRDGYTRIHTFTDTVHGALSVREDDGDAIYAIAGTALWRIGGTVQNLGTLPGADFLGGAAAEMFFFAGKLYILGGGDYFCYDGASVSRVEGYIPLIRRNASYFDTGTEFERVNLLTNRVRMRFKPDGGNSQYRLWGNVASVESATYNGNPLQYSFIYGAAYSLIKFANIPAAADTDAIEVYFTLRDAPRRGEITSCAHAAVYGGDTDSRVFVYGGSVASSLYPSDPQDAYVRQTLSAEYFPAGGEITVGDGNLYVTGAVRQFDRLAIFTEDSAFYTYPKEEAPVNGVTRYSFPILPLNSDVGASRSGGAVLVENEPYALNENGLFRFKSTSVRDERLAVLTQAPDSVGLTRDFINSCKLYVNRLRGELWCVGSHIIVYNARQNVWYRFSGITPDLMFTHASDAAFASGRSLYRFSSDAADDAGTPITASYDSGALDLGDAFDCKTLYEFGVSMERVPGAKLDCVLTGDTGETLALSFTVPDGDVDIPAAIRSHARLGHASYIRFRLTSPAGSPAADIREVSLGYRAR